jgi:tRNA pseudouridine55 synthase
VLKSFVGEYWQTPPMYSAIKINGKKLYELARKGKEIERPPRLVNIYEIVPINGNKIGVTCSKGTYIRTLCADIGKKLGGYAHMGSLERTRSGVFLVKDSIRLDAIRLCLANGTFADILQNVET